MSHKNKLRNVLLTVVIALGLITLWAGADYFEVFANNSQVCDESAPWVKVGGSPYTYNAGPNQIIDAVCIKGGNENSPNDYLVTLYADGWHQLGGENCVSASGIGTSSASASRNGEAEGNVCADISHVSFRLADKPDPTEETPEPTEETPEPTEETPEEPKNQPLSIQGVCETDFVVWTITNGNNKAISFSWTATNGQSGNGNVPASESIKLNTNLDASGITISYSLNNEPAELKGTVEVCSEEPTPTKTEPPKEETPTPESTEEPTPDPTEVSTSESTPEPTEAKPQVDPKPDVAAGGRAPSFGSIFTLLGIAAVGIGSISFFFLKIKKLAS